MSGFAFLPEALDHLNKVWDFIAADSIDGAARTVAELFDGIRGKPPCAGKNGSIAKLLLWPVCKSVSRK